MTDIFFSMDEILVSRTANGDFEVLVEDDYDLIIVEEGFVESIFNLLGTMSVSKEEIAAIVACIKHIQRKNKTGYKMDGKWPDIIKELNLIQVTAELLNHYSADEVLQYIKEKKWHEIVSVYQSSNPIMKLVEEEINDAYEEEP